MRLSIALLFGLMLIGLTATAQRGHRGHRGGHGHHVTTNSGCGPAYAPARQYTARTQCGPRTVYRARPARRVVRNCAPVYQARVWVPACRVWDPGCGMWVWRAGYWRYY